MTKKKSLWRRLAMIVSLLGCCALFVGVILFRAHRVTDRMEVLIAPTPVPAAASPTPAPTPTPELFDPALRAKWAEEAGALRLSELMVKNGATLPDEDGDFSDWLELENLSERTIELEGWTLSDKESGGKGWTFPAVSIGAGERLLVFASGKDRTLSQLHTDFSLSENERLSLFAPDGTEVFSLTIPALDRDCSLIAPGEGGYEPCFWLTPGQSNDAEGYERWQESRNAAGPLQINEVMVANYKGYWNAPAGYDWVELENISDESVELSDYYLSDDGSDYHRYRLPEGKLLPGQRYLVLCDKDSVDYAPFSLDAERETLFLTSETQLCDYAALHDVPYRGSYGRLDGENGFFYFSTPTPGAENDEGFRRVSASPVTLQSGGVFENVDSITVTLEGAGAIYYTLDGSYPTGESTLYTGPFALTETTVLRAVSLEEGALPSRALTESYFINEGHTLPVASLVSDVPGNFNYMYEKALKGMEIPGSLSFYEQDGSFSIGCGISMSGATSLELPKKNVSVHFRGAYGSSWLHYDLFDGGVADFSSLTFRAGQDYYYAIIRDEVCQNLALQFSPEHVATQRSKYCVLYVNGRYYGVYALKEKINRQFFASWAGVSKDSVVVEDGPVNEWISFGKEVFAFVRDHDMTDEENYAHFCEIADVDSFIDFLILEGYSGNPDILLGNVRYGKSTESDGKWYVIFYDLDDALRHRDTTFYNLIGDGERAYIQQITKILLPLLQNEHFRTRFLERFSEAIYGTLSDENVLAEIDCLYAEIESELPRDFKRWGRVRSSFEFEFNHFRNLIADGYAQYAIETVCDLLSVTDSEREQYFPRSAH